MKKIILFLIIFITLAILSIGIFLFIRQWQSAVTNLEKFYKLTSEDPLFYSPFFDSTEWEKSIKILKQTENQLREIKIKNYEQLADKQLRFPKDAYVATPGENELFPYQFLENLILINQKTNEFLENPSAKLANDLLDSYSKAADSYIQPADSIIKLFKKYSALNYNPYVFFVDSVTSASVLANDFNIIKENGYKLKEEVEKRRNCLAGKDPCLVSPQNNKKIDTFIDSLNAEFPLGGRKINFIKKNIFYFKPTEVKDPYKITSSCWQNPNSEQWLYLFFSERDTNELHLKEAIAKLATQNYYYSTSPKSFRKITDLALANRGLKFRNQLETTTYECSDLTFYPQLMTLNFVKEQIENNKITIENLKKERDYKLLIENQFGLISPAINVVSEYLNNVRLSQLVDKDLEEIPYLYLTRSAYSIFYFPFASSIWRTDKQLQYFTPEQQIPSTVPSLKAVTFDELEKLGYTETEIAKFQIDGGYGKFFKSLLPQTEP